MYRFARFVPSHQERAAPEVDPVGGLRASFPRAGLCLWFLGNSWPGLAWLRFPLSQRIEERNKRAHHFSPASCGSFKCRCVWACPFLLRPSTQRNYLCAKLLEALSEVLPWQTHVKIPHIPSHPLCWAVTGILPCHESCSKHWRVRTKKQKLYFSPVALTEMGSWFSPMFF